MSLLLLPVSVLRFNPMEPGTEEVFNMGMIPNGPAVTAASEEDLTCRGLISQS